MTLDILEEMMQKGVIIIKDDSFECTKRGSECETGICEYYDPCTELNSEYYDNYGLDFLSENYPEWLI